MEDLAGKVRDLSITPLRKADVSKTKQANHDEWTVKQEDKDHGVGFFTNNQHDNWHTSRQMDHQKGSDSSSVKPRSHGMTTRSQRRMDQPQPWRRQGGGQPKIFSLKRPEPTAEYLAQANVPSVKLQEARPLLIVVDLNGTLIRKTSGTNFARRSFVNEFLRYVDRCHTLMIWSTARPETVHDRCKHLFEEAGLSVPDLIWDRKHFNLTAKQYEGNTQVYKQLSRVWEHDDVKTAAPHDVVFDQTNTILIDDTGEKAVSEPYNHLEISEFVAGVHEFGELAQVVQYLEGARFQSNVSSYIKAHRFVLDTTMPPYDFEALWTTLDRQDISGPPVGEQGDDEEDGGVALRSA